MSKIVEKSKKEKFEAIKKEIIEERRRKREEEINNYCSSLVDDIIEKTVTEIEKERLENFCNEKANSLNKDYENLLNLSETFKKNYQSLPSNSIDLIKEKVNFNLNGNYNFHDCLSSSTGNDIHINDENQKYEIESEDDGDKVIDENDNKTIITIEEFDEDTLNINDDNCESENKNTTVDSDTESFCNSVVLYNTDQSFDVSAELTEIFDIRDNLMNYMSYKLRGPLFVNCIVLDTLFHNLFPKDIVSHIYSFVDNIDRPGEALCRAKDPAWSAIYYGDFDTVDYDDATDEIDRLNRRGCLFEGDDDSDDEESEDDDDDENNDDQNDYNDTNNNDNNNTDNQENNDNNNGNDNEENNNSESNNENNGNNDNNDSENYNNEENNNNDNNSVNSSNNNNDGNNDDDDDDDDEEKKENTDAINIPETDDVKETKEEELPFIKEKITIDKSESSLQKIQQPKTKDSAKCKLFVSGMKNRCGFPKIYCMHHSSGLLKQKTFKILSSLYPKFDPSDKANKTSTYDSFIKKYKGKILETGIKCESPFNGDSVEIDVGVFDVTDLKNHEITLSLKQKKILIDGYPVDGIKIKNVSINLPDSYYDDFEKQEEKFKIENGMKCKKLTKRTRKRKAKKYEYLNQIFGTKHKHIDYLITFHTGFVYLLQRLSEGRYCNFLQCPHCSDPHSDGLSEEVKYELFQKHKKHDCSRCGRNFGSVLAVDGNALLHPDFKNSNKYPSKIHLYQNDLTDYDVHFKLFNNKNDKNEFKITHRGYLLNETSSTSKLTTNIEYIKKLITNYDYIIKKIRNGSGSMMDDDVPDNEEPKFLNPTIKPKTEKKSFRRTKTELINENQNPTEKFYTTDETFEFTGNVVRASDISKFVDMLTSNNIEINESDINELIKKIYNKTKSKQMETMLNNALKRAWKIIKNPELLDGFYETDSDAENDDKTKKQSNDPLPVITNNYFDMEKIKENDVKEESNIEYTIDKKKNESIIYLYVSPENEEYAKNIHLKRDYSKKCYYMDSKFPGNKEEVLSKFKQITPITLKKRAYLKVPFEKKDLAKSYGAQFDSFYGVWFLPSSTTLENWDFLTKEFEQISEKNLEKYVNNEVIYISSWFNNNGDIKKHEGKFDYSEGKWYIPAYASEANRKYLLETYGEYDKEVCEKMKYEYNARNGRPTY